ncbi:MAG: hypothetical protein RKP20_01135 [Candidatus Competibacter sp.]|nr:hypothetical protein [Candidatus Competibacter sp.]
MLEKLLRSFASAAMMMAVALPSTAVGGFEYAISGSVISADFVANFAELSAHPTIAGFPVNSLTLFGPGDTPALDLTAAFFGTGDLLDGPPPIIDQGLTETDVFSVPIPPSFFPVLAGGEVGVSFLATDTVDGLFAIDYIGLHIVTTSGVIDADIGGHDGFGIGLPEGVPLSVPLTSLGPTGTGFDEPISSKAHENHIIPAPATVWLVIAGLGGLAALRARLRRAAPASLLALMLAALAVSAPPARALVQELSVEDMAQQASWILEGRVDEMYSAASADGSQIYTFITFQVINSQLKGSSLPNPLVLRVLGGQVGSDAMLIPEGPTFELGARMVLFIGPNPQSPFPIVGLGQGAFILTFDSALGEDRADNGEGLSLRRSELIQRINDELGP